MAKPVVFVTGASGQVGLATATALSQRYGKEVTILAGTRSPERAEDLKALDDVSIVKAEMGDPNMERALTGVDCLYIIAPAVENRAELVRKTVDAAGAAGVGFILALSICTADCPETIFGKHFSDIENHVRAAGVPYTFLRLPAFYENIWAHQKTIMGQRVFYGPVGADKQFTLVAVRDAGVAAAAILRRPSVHLGKTYNIVSDRHSNADLAQDFTTALGKKVKYIQISYGQIKPLFKHASKLPKWQLNGILELARLADDEEPAVNQEDLSDFETITGETPTSLAAWVAVVAGAFKLRVS
ncbi:uncharacterized protein LOC135815656 [Sycon ciliatum]|uniref:uncharacterized protein LOC135815656 n=1 Tax=Sycon ciliatum TaxID=27933 RepID=UPI0020AD7450|eukprot:scpid71130/ scgid30988/ Quinone oxidoreductase 2